MEIKSAIKKIILSAFVSLFLISSCTNNNSNKYPRIENINLTLSSAEAEKISTLVHAFNDEYKSKYQIILNTYDDSNLLNYYFSHDYIDTDIIAFDNLNVANSYSDYLQPLNRFESVGQYQSSIIYLLKDEHDDINVFPGPGDLYSLCYNMDLMKKRNFTIPETASELVETAKRMQIYSNPCIVLGENQLYFDSFLRVAIPMFIGTTKGSIFIKEYYKGYNTIGNSLYYGEFETILKMYQSMFRYDFYNTDETLSNNDKMNLFFNSEAMILGISPSIDFEKEYKTRKATFNYSIYPLVGEDSNQKWVASKPRYYLGVSKKGFEKSSPSKKSAINAFFDFYSSEKGQKAAMMDSDGFIKNDIISYIKDSEYVLSSNFEQLQDSIKSGRVMITDLIEQLFLPETSILKQYALQETSLDQCIQSLDEAIFNRANKAYDTYQVEETFDYDNALINYNELLISDYVVDSIRMKSGAAIALMPTSIINGNFIKGSLTSEELSIVINDKKGILVRISGEGIKKIINDKMSLYLRSAEFPLISGIRLNKEADNLEVKLANGQIINDDNIVLAYIPYSWYVEYEEYITSIGKVTNIIDLLSQKIKEDNNIIKYTIKDGRYGNVMVMR